MRSRAPSFASVSVYSSLSESHEEKKKEKHHRLERSEMKKLLDRSTTGTRKEMKQNHCSDRYRHVVKSNQQEKRTHPMCQSVRSVRWDSDLDEELEPPWTGTFR